MIWPWRKRRVLVLCYHRVHAPHSDPNGLCIHPEVFADQLDWLVRHHALLTVDDLTRGVLSGRLPRRGVVITFDDGYADFHRHAWPALAQRQVPSTLFLSPEDLDRAGEFWWDEVERHLFAPDRRGGDLVLASGGREGRWRLPPPGAGDEVGAGELRRAYGEIQAWFRFAPPAERRAGLEAIRAWSALPAAPRPENRPLSREELLEVAADPLVSIGSHGLDHLSLARQESDVVARELTESKAGLETLLAREVPWYAYAYGWHEDYSPAVMEQVERAGYRVAFATTDRALEGGESPFALPRCLVRNWSGEELGRRMEAWSAG